MISYLSQDLAFIKFLLIGIFTGLVVTLDGYARGQILTPTKKNGEVHKARTVALYLSIILFSSFAAIIMGAIAQELKLSSNMSFIIAGLGGIVGRDIIHVLSRNFLKNVEQKTNSVEELTAFIDNIKTMNNSMNSTNSSNCNNSTNSSSNNTNNSNRTFNEIDNPQKDSK